MAWLAMAANKCVLTDHAGNYYRYCVGGVDCGTATPQTDGTGGYPRDGHSTRLIHPCKDFGDDNPQYRQALKYDHLVAIRETAVG